VASKTELSAEIELKGGRYEIGSTKRK